MKKVLEGFFSSLSDSKGMKKDFLVLLKVVRAKSGQRVFFYGSCDITNRCNLKCKHCYWWKNYDGGGELSIEEFEEVIEVNFVKNNIVQVALTGGEPLLRPEVIELFNEKELIL